MDMRSKLLALLVFTLFAVVLVWTGFYLRTAAEATQKELIASFPAELSRGSGTRTSRGSSAARGDESSRTELLRTQVERLSARVNRLSELLEQKTADYDTLKTDFDHNADVLRELLAPVQATTLTKTDLEEAEAGKTESAEELLAELNAQLRDARDELAILEKEAARDELQIFELEERSLAFESAASDSLVRAGAAAVPGLAELLFDRSAEIRRWAAGVLGAIGPDATAAVDALHEALSDSDEDVRIAARKALRRIERP